MLRKMIERVRRWRRLTFPKSYVFVVIDDNRFRAVWVRSQRLTLWNMQRAADAAFAKLNGPVRELRMSHKARRELLQFYTDVGLFAWDIPIVADRDLPDHTIGFVVGD